MMETFSVPKEVVREMGEVVCTCGNQSNFFLQHHIFFSFIERDLMRSLVLRCSECCRILVERVEKVGD